MTTEQQEAWLAAMAQSLEIELDDARRAELLARFSHIAAMAAPLMDYPLDERLDIAGVYRP